MIKIENEKVNRILSLNVEDVEKLFLIDVTVDFIPYVGTINRKYLNSIKSIDDNYKQINIHQFAKKLAELCNITNYKTANVKMEYYAYWNDDGDIEWHNTLEKGVQSISLYIEE